MKLILIIFSLFFVANTSAEVYVNLKFGIYGSDRLSEINRKFTPVLDEIKKNMSISMGMPVNIEMVFYKTYEEGIEAIVEGKVDFIRLGPVSYVLAKQKNPDISIIATEAYKGSKNFNGVICVRASSPIYDIEQLKGTKFIFGNKRSTSGRYMSQKYLYDHGIKSSDFIKFGYASNHDDVAISVAQGFYDAGAFKSGILKNKLLSKVLRVIAEFPVVTHPWVARKNMTIELRNHVRDALLNIKDINVFKGLKRTGFVAGSDKDYENIRKAINNNDLFFQ